MPTAKRIESIENAMSVNVTETTVPQKPLNNLRVPGFGPLEAVVDEGA